MLGQLVAFFAIFCAFVLLPGVVLGWSVASKWLDLQQEMLLLEREKVRLLSEQAHSAGPRPVSGPAGKAALPDEGEPTGDRGV
jgi:hypothetical protein